MVQFVQQAIEVPQLLLDKMINVAVVVVKVINIPVVAQRPFPMVLAVWMTVETTGAGRGGDS